MLEFLNTHQTVILFRMRLRNAEKIDDVGIG